MIPAKNNIIVKTNVPDNGEYAILNPISGSFDIMNEREHEMLKQLNEGKIPEEGFASYLIERGYAFETLDAMKSATDKAYHEFNEEVRHSQVQLMLVPTYGCNLACTYCFQHGIQRGTDLSPQGASLNLDSRPTLITQEAVDAFFEYARDNFLKGSAKPFITLFGGEPLVNTPSQRSIIEYIVKKCIQENYELAAVTNGYNLTEYIDILKNVKVKEIQVTLDGSREIHDGRRATANNKGTFDRIISGMEACIKEGMPINLRSVVDLENIEDIVNLSEFLDSKGWLDLPPELFKTQLGRNYELFDCYAKPQHLMTQVELWGKFAALSKRYPVLAKFHRPDFKGIRHLVDTGEMYMASFDTCPACKTEWVFDLYGHIYGCTASCGREEYLLGTYWPEVKLDNNMIDTWKSRDVKIIPECKECKYDVICGGGCGVVAANKNNGRILSPDCRPTQELLELGVNHYINDIREMSEEEHNSNVIENLRCNCGDKKTEGCIICGKELVYRTDIFNEMCMICGQNFETYVKCPEGHYVCDRCHTADIFDKIEQFLENSSIKDPVELAEKVFELPGLNMHGPEYHSIVPAVIVTAYQNITGYRDSSKIKEAIKRGKGIKGGSCGFNGNCGSAVGAGIASSILENTTPMSNVERGNANKATGYALLAISKHGGPRCCKRETITAIESFIQTSKYFGEVGKTEYKCTQYSKNKDCIGSKCPYLPKKI